jgi:hypothetical protein
MACQFRCRLAARDRCSRRDNLELDAETLDGVGDAAKEMDLERVQEQDGDDSDRGRGDIWLEDIIDPIEHGGLVALGCIAYFISWGWSRSSRAAIRPYLVPL